jgi:hypothetical protein
MDAADNKKSLTLGIPGLVLQGIGTYAVQGVTGALLSIAGAGLLIAGLCFYARGKGYPMLLGALGLLSCLGLIILAVLPDKRK